MQYMVTRDLPKHHENLAKQSEFRKRAEMKIQYYLTDTE